MSSEHIVLEETSYFCAVLKFFRINFTISSVCAISASGQRKRTTTTVSVFELRDVCDTSNIMMRQLDRWTISEEGAFAVE